MFRRSTLATSAASLLLLTALPVVAHEDLPGSLGGTLSIYIGEGRIFEALPARQMTLRGHVLEFQYSPTGEKIAYEGLLVDHGEQSLVIKFVDPWRTDPVEKFVAKSAAFDARAEKPGERISLAGWSGDGRYLIVQRTKMADDGASAANGGDGQSISVTFECYDTQGDLASPKIVRLPMGFAGARPLFAWSPDRTRLLFAVDVVDEEEARSDSAESVSAIHHSAIVYRPEDDSRQNIQSASDKVIVGWLDDQSLLEGDRADVRMEKSDYVRYDIGSGAVEVVPEPEHWGMVTRLALETESMETKMENPKYPDLTLEVVSQEILDSPHAEHVGASAIWIRRAAGKKKFAAAPIGVTPGSEPPMPRWSPTGEAVAFLAHGDLFVSDLVKRAATDRETLNAGDKIDCAEERKIVQSNLKQIGLGLLQYLQDYDERLPPASNVQDRIYPYIKNADVFSLADSNFTYRGNSKMTTGNIEAPSKLVIGEMDTPCAHNYLYLDGSVKSIDK